jgi:hypothetical protein
VCARSATLRRLPEVRSPAETTEPGRIRRVALQDRPDRPRLSEQLSLVPPHALTQPLALRLQAESKSPPAELVRIGQERGVDA